MNYLLLIIGFIILLPIIYILPPVYSRFMLFLHLLFSLLYVSLGFMISSFIHWSVAIVIVLILAATTAIFFTKITVDSESGRAGFYEN